LTVLGLAPRGYFIPYRYARRASAVIPPSYPAVAAVLEGRRARFRDVIEGLAPYAEDLARIGSRAAPAPRWDQSWFPRMDAAVAYGLVRRLKPRRIVEVGSGHSTRFLVQAIEDGGLPTRITAIDPAPRASLSDLAVDLRRATLQDAGRECFADLSAGDMMLVDSSHLLMPGSDVDLLLGDILPRLADGVWVQFHDIFLPDDYPACWAWRGYNEQQGLLQLILGEAWEVMFASHYASSRLEDVLAASAIAGLPLMAEAHESALWLRKRNR
jgi:predicted O-methyltransferase YrrM